MTKQESIKLLRSDVDAWNKYREDNPDWVPDLRDADLRGANLRRADLLGANLRRADLRHANLTGANLRDADLRDADLRWADLLGANLTGANLRHAGLRWANLLGADLDFSSGLPLWCSGWNVHLCEKNTKLLLHQATYNGWDSIPDEIKNGSFMDAVAWMETHHRINETGKIKDK